MSGFWKLRMNQGFKGLKGTTEKRILQLGKAKLQLFADNIFT